MRYIHNDTSLPVPIVSNQTPLFVHTCAASDLKWVPRELVLPSQAPADGVAIFPYSMYVPSGSNSTHFRFSSS